MAKVLNDLYDYVPLKIYQDPECFKFSLDSILLSEYVNTNGAKKILDLCTGNASIPLILSTKTKAKIVGFEIQKYIYDLGISSIQYNDLSNQIEIFNDDIKNIDKYLNGEKYDIITCNPPFFKVNDIEKTNNKEMKRIARHEVMINLEEIFKIASIHLDDGKSFYLVQRTDRLDEIILLGNKYNLNVKNIELIKTKENSKPYIVLVRCIKNSKLGIKINDVKTVSDYKTYKDMFKEVV